jgi:hypothetical protein
MSVSCEYCVLSLRRAVHSSRGFLPSVIVCDREASIMRKPWVIRCCATGRKKITTYRLERVRILPNMGIILIKRESARCARNPPPSPRFCCLLVTTVTASLIIALNATRKQHLHRAIMPSALATSKRKKTGYKRPCLFGVVHSSTLQLANNNNNNIVSMIYE